MIKLGYEPGQYGSQVPSTASHLEGTRGPTDVEYFTYLKIFSSLSVDYKISYP